MAQLANAAGDRIHDPAVQQAPRSRALQRRLQGKLIGALARAVLEDIRRGVYWGGGASHARALKEWALTTQRGMRCPKGGGTGAAAYLQQRLH